MSSEASVLWLENGQQGDLRSLSTVSAEELQNFVVDAFGRGEQLLSFHACQLDGQPRLLACIGGRSQVGLLAAPLGEKLVSMVERCPAAHLFEREVAEQTGVPLVGHPSPYPVRFVDSGSDSGAGDGPTIGNRPFFRVEGLEVHEVAVGPVHAGVIEPGHFRFQCHGETVFHLEISLGYQHRGVEKEMLAGPSPKAFAVAQTVAGDSTIAHTSNYCRLLEGFSNSFAPAKAELFRAVGLELERMANHAGDLGALAGDVAFLPTASYCGRLRGDLLNLTAALCGNRFGRGLVVPGGVGFDVDSSLAKEIREKLTSIMRDLTNAVELMFDAPSVLARFEGTGLVGHELAVAVGLVGPSARAAGLEVDARERYPVGHYRFAQIPISTWNHSDVFGRAFVRWLEIQRSYDFVLEALSDLPGGPVRKAVRELEPGKICVAITEGWRGAVTHVATTGSEGQFSSYKIVDPSFYNWTGLALALRGQAISDFPLCNKSFNLSYCGHDL